MFFLAHREELPTKLPKHAPNRKEPSSIHVLPVEHLGHRLAEPCDDTLLAQSALVWGGIDKKVLSPSMIATPGLGMVQEGKSADPLTKLACVCGERTLP